jgi:hypothetical protein
MKTLVKSLKSTLMLGLEDRDPGAFRPPAPHVYVKAIACEADLITSLSGVAEITRALGFTEAPETLYGDGGHSATYHVDHGDVSVSIAVECNPQTKTVALAVSGLDVDATYDQFNATVQALFGDC